MGRFYNTLYNKGTTVPHLKQNLGGLLFTKTGIFLHAPNLKSKKEVKKQVF